jgi:hypothetical protein
MDAQGFANWIQQNRQQAPALAGQVQAASRQNMAPMQPPPPPRPTFDPSQGAPPGMGSMGGKPGQFGNEVPGTVGPQYGPGGQGGSGQRFSPQASSGNIFAPPGRDGQPGNSSQPMGVRNAPNLFGKGPSAGPPGPPAPQGRDYGATMGPRGAAPMGPSPRPINALGPVNPSAGYGPQGPRPTAQPGGRPLIPGAGAIAPHPIGIGGVPIPKAGG